MAISNAELWAKMRDYNMAQQNALLQVAIGQNALGSLAQIFNQQQATPKAVPTPPLPRETAFGEIIAWRIWKLKAGYLHSSYRDDLWLPGETMEAKNIEDHNQAGFHAWKDKRTCVTYSVEQDATLILGQVKLWGTIIHHERGYRGQFARIVSLDDLTDPETHANAPLLEAMRAKYLPAAKAIP